MEEPLYTLADLARFTDMKRRTIQLWADAGALQAEKETDRAGTGNHRRFSRIEGLIACILVAFADKSIGHVRRVADVLRRLLNEDPTALEDVEGVLRDDRPVLLFLTQVGPADGTGKLFAQLVLRASEKRHADRQAAEILDEFMPFLTESRAKTEVILLNTYLRRV